VSVEFAEGVVLLERFRLVRALGLDGPSHLWVAEDVELLESVAIRVFPQYAERVRIACRNARRLRHRNIVPVFDFYREDETCFIARAFVEGGNISTLRGRPAEEQIRGLVAVLDALEYAHREGVVHGDLKGTKILVDRSGDAHVADFGISGALREEALRPGEDVSAVASVWFEGGDWTDPGAVKRALSEGPDDVTVPVRVGLPVTARSDASSQNVWILAGFAALLFMAIGVFFVLPRLVGPPEEPAARETATATPEKGAQPSAAVAGVEGATPDDARRLLGEVLNRSERLRKIGVAQWGPDGIAVVDEHVAAGELAQVDDDPATAVGHYREALTALEGLEARAEEVLAQALEAGAAAIAELDLPEATRQFGTALVVDPENATATSGLERVHALEQIVTFMAAGERHERDGEVDEARDAYAQAMGVDAEWAPAREALARIDAVIAATAYDRNMAQAVTALAKSDLDAAQVHVGAALAVRPASSEARDLRRRIQQKRVTIAITSGRSRAEAFESKEQWSKATEEYRRLLQLDPNLVFAESGFDRASRRASISDRFDAWIATPALLFDERQRTEARELIASARSTPNPGPRLRRQVEQVEALERTASTPVEVVFESDGLTEVQVGRLGPIGSFERRQVSMTPGVYVIRGIRRGFRDVRQTVTVIPGQAVPTVVVRCTEKI
jgi:serine/threonine protein kinase